ncbi:MAG TPA: NnrS family protein [Kiritimatiellia bacterium]|nr:NnrS family protein [Kiritimatiellia bacterium]
MKNFVKLWFEYSSQGEPYRILFPLGAMIGAFGVFLWPAFVMGWISFYPGIPHARIMTQGFVFCFMAGFLGSALPHMLEVKGMNLKGALIICVLVLVVTALHAMQRTFWGDVVFVILVATTIAMALHRWPERNDLPPPGMMLAAIGLICGISGTILMSLAQAGWVNAYMYSLGRLLLYQGMILLPVLGLGVYLLPRMAGLPNRHKLPAGRHPSRAWKTRAYFMLACGGLILISFAMEVAGYTRTAFALRFATATFCLLHEAPLYRARQIDGSIPRGLMIAAGSILLGYLTMAIWPAWQMSLLHIVYISGFGLLIVNIAARVILGHSGNTDEIYSRHRAINWIARLALLAMATRVSADVIPSMQWSHYAYAALTWMAITLIWLAKFAPFLAHKNPEP